MTEVRLLEGLVLVREGGEGARHPVQAEMVIGSGRASDLRLRESGVQRRHVVIEHFSSGYAIRSLGSRAHVLVNEQPVSRRMLHPGDRVVIGPVKFTVEAIEPAPEAGPADVGRPHAAVPEDPVPAAVLARVRTPEMAPPLFSRTPASRRRSAATHHAATWVFLAIVLADAIALAFYIEGI